MVPNQLPKPFKMWQPWLSWFDEDLQPIVADLLLQLNNLLGPMKESMWNAQQQLSGLGDLRKRGSYEHLLSSEWLIAEEEPDEFIRRVIAHEHLFLNPIPEKSKANGVIIGLFDSGILQLGVPRVVHLILMLLLNIRSHNHNSQFYWGVIQNKPKLRQFDNIYDLQMLLKNRTIQLVNNTMVTNWSEYLTQSQLNYDECWLIGPNYTKPEFITHQVNIDKLIKQQHQLSVEIKTSSMVRQRHLTLPNEAICARIVAGQFTSGSDIPDLEEKSLESINVNLKPIISPNGLHILTYNNDNTKLCLINLRQVGAIKQSCKIRYYHFNNQIIDYHLNGKDIFLLIIEQKRLFLWQTRNPKIEISVNINIEVTGSRFLCFSKPPYFYREIYILDANNSLLSLRLKNKDEGKFTQVEKEAENVVGLFPVYNNRIGYIYYNEQQQLFFKCTYFIERLLLGVTRQNDQQYYLAAEKLWGKNGSFGRLAIGSGQKWQLFRYYDDYINVNVPQEWLVFGIFYHDKQDKTDFLVMNQDKKQIALFDFTTNKINVFMRLAYKIVNYSYNSQAQSIAITTDNGELILYSLLTESIRLKLT